MHVVTITSRHSYIEVLTNFSRIFVHNLDSFVGIKFLVFLFAVIGLVLTLSAS